MTAKPNIHYYVHYVQIRGGSDFLGGRNNENLEQIWGAAGRSLKIKAKIMHCETTSRLSLRMLALL